MKRASKSPHYFDDEARGRIALLIIWLVFKKGIATEPLRRLERRNTVRQTHQMNGECDERRPFKMHKYEAFSAHWNATFWVIRWAGNIYRPWFLNQALNPTEKVIKPCYHSTWFVDSKIRPSWSLRGRKRRLRRTRTTGHIAAKYEAPYLLFVKDLKCCIAF